MSTPHANAAEQASWESRYQTGDVPWDNGVPDPKLKEVLRTAGLTVGKALDLGCGSGTNVVWLAQQGWEVVGLDLAPTAIGCGRSMAN